MFPFYIVARIQSNSKLIPFLIPLPDHTFLNKVFLLDGDR